MIGDPLSHISFAPALTLSHLMCAATPATRTIARPYTWRARSRLDTLKAVPVANASYHISRTHSHECTHGVRPRSATF